MRRWACVFGVVAALSGEAWAHPGHVAPSFAGGFAHPVTGLDHVLAMLAVGLWAAQSGGRARWVLPLTFVAVMGVGGALGTAGVRFPLVEAGIASSVVALGLLIACAARWPMAISAPLVGAFALLHGHAHGTELPAAASGSAYAAGFVTATAMLHGAGLWLGHAAATRGHVRLVRAAGAGIAVVGTVLAIS